jgi:hypothetical protein
MNASAYISTFSVSGALLYANICAGYNDVNGMGWCDEDAIRTIT